MLAHREHVAGTALQPATLVEGRGAGDGIQQVNRLLGALGCVDIGETPPGQERRWCPLASLPCGIYLARHLIDVRVCRAKQHLCLAHPVVRGVNVAEPGTAHGWSLRRRELLESVY